MSTLTLDNNSTLHEYLSEDFSVYEVFKKYDIDFNQHMDCTLTQIAEIYQLNAELLHEELEEKISNKTSETATDDSLLNILNLEQLCDLIEYKYHHYLITNIPKIKSELNRLKQENAFPNIDEVYTLFSETAETLVTHMGEEENELFPAIRKMVKHNEQIAVKELIEKMEDEHEEEGVYFRKMETLTNNYTPPQNSDSDVKRLFSRMKDFHICLMKHVYIENNVLFTKVVNSSKVR